MDQIKIGKFIASCRKEHSLTQAALAEKLGITDRAVSKWETGKSLPDSLIMLELCEILSINVTELLKGEHIMEENNKKVSESIIVSLKKQNEERSAQMLKLEVLIGIIVLIIFLSLCGFGIYLDYTSPEIAHIPIIIGLVLMVAFAFTGVWIEQQAGYYECAECGHRYKPEYMAALMAPHIGRSRKMKCPCCGKKSYNKKVISGNNED